MLQMGSLSPIVHDLHQSLVELLERPEILSLHAVRRVGRERQLHLKVRALCGEVEKIFDVLVDTGAQVSLVKAGLLPPECLTDSRKPVRLKVANGQYMVGGTKEATIGLQFVNHRELSRPDLGKEILLHGSFYEAETDWDMIVGYDFMMETDSGVLPAQASMTLYQDDQLSWLLSPEHHVACQWIHPERNQLEVAALDTEPTGPANQEYGVRPEVASRVVADLGASDLALDAFSSGTSAHLRVCEKYWSAQDSAWKKHWGPHQGLMWIHCPRWDIPRAIAKIRKDRSKAVLVVPMGCTEEESTRHWVASLTNMTLNKVVLPAGESVYQDAKGQPMPPQRWPTEFHYVDGGLDQADTTDFVCVNRIIAEPWRQCFAVPPVDIEESDSEDPLTEEEWDLVQGYMDQPFHDWGNQREGKGQDKAWWEVDSIVSGSYDGNTFVQRVLDHMSSQDEPPGGNPPTYGDLFRGKTRDGPLGHLGRPPEPKASGVATPQVSSVVQVPGKAKAESDDCPKIQALRARLKQKYGETFFSGKPVFPPPVRGPYGEAKIRLKQDPRVYRHREFALKGERKEAMEKILRDFIQRGWLEPCHSEWASPCFVVPKKVAGEWRLVVDYRGLNAQTQHDSYTLPLIEDMLQKQHRRRIFTVIDLKHGYHQMPLAEESRACTAMSTPLGPLQWKVMPMMIRHWLTVFDIPRTICSDRGPQFTGGWFKAMCSLMGIRHAKSVAYLSRSNGRAEVAGRQLFEKLRKIHITNPRRNWFEEMWPALKAHHDTPTPGGLSPHQILFGRDPLGRGLPLSGDGMAMDAKEFFARQEQTARDIRQQLEKEHAERQKSAPSSTAQKFRVGDPVWVIRPRPMGTHRTKTWFTPGEVVRRIGEDTYRIKVGHGQFRERHESQLRVREPDLRGRHVSLDYAKHEADSDDDYAEQDDYTVEKILAQRPKASAPGGLEFKVRWRGYGPSHDTWEPVSSFVPRVNTPFMEYIRKHKTKIHVSDLAALTRAIAARGA